MASGVLQTLFELADTLYISWLGSEQISGVALALPVMFFVYAIGTAVSVGVAALVSRHLGARKQNEAQDTLNHAFGLALTVGGSMSLVGVLAAPQLVAVLGGEGPLLEYGTQYLRIIIAAAALTHVGTVADAALRAQGNTVTPMKVMAAGNLANLILDPVFIFGLGLVVRGAAWATLLTRSVMCIVLVLQLWGPHSRVRPGRVPGLSWGVRWRVIGEIYWIGLPSSVGMLGMSFSTMVINKLLVTLNETAVGVLGIAWRLEAFALLPVFALFSAVLPMVGYNLGARLYDRCRQTIRSASVLAAALMGFLGVFLFAFPQTFMRAFGNDPAIVHMGAEYLRINSWVYAFVGWSIMLSAGFQGLGKSYLAMICQLWRTLVVKVPLAYLLAAFYGVTGVWWSFPISSLSAVALAAALMSLVLRRLGTGDSNANRA